ncbi:MAG TPA: FAD:protein FMN transferase [Burkholderiaceae bacterium]|nr:FAD:protein FMN transferase [Burkholderiaceae bacterium]
MDALISTRRRALLLGAAGSAALAACQRGAERNVRVHFSGETMGSVYNVKLDPSRHDAERLADVVRRALQSVDERMSLFRPDSELAAFNAAPAGVPVPLSEDLFAVIAAAQEISRWSDGAFDATVAPMVESWGFGVHKHRSVPETGEIAAERAHVGWQALKLDAARRTAVKTRPRLRLDLNGIACGFAVDRAAEALDALGVQHYMIEATGEVRVRGHNAAGQAWQIGIEQPDAMPQRARHVVPMAAGAMSTSGDYRNYYEQDGRRYCHEIDPVTGAPISHPLCSVSVVADDCMRADALSTALIVLGPERGFALAEANGIAAQFIRRAGAGRFVDRMTSAFAALGARTNA